MPDDLEFEFEFARVVKFKVKLKFKLEFELEFECSSLVQMAENVAQGLFLVDKVRQTKGYCVPEKSVNFSLSTRESRNGKTDFLLQTLVGQRFHVALLSSKN